MGYKLVVVSKIKAMHSNSSQFYIYIKYQKNMVGQREADSKGKIHHFKVDHVKIWVGGHIVFSIMPKQISHTWTNDSNWKEEGLRFICFSFKYYQPGESRHHTLCVVMCVYLFYVKFVAYIVFSWFEHYKTRALYLQYCNVGVLKNPQSQFGANLGVRSYFSESKSKQEINNVDKDKKILSTV